jgi:hypothetical protein
LPKDSPIHYEQGDPATAILRAIERNNIDVIVAGALEKEVLLHPFLGNVARRLLGEGTNSVILFTHPAREPEPLRKIVFLAEYSEHSSNSLRRTLHLAAREKSERVSPTETDDDVKLEHFVLALGHTDVPIEVRCIRGNTGFAAADFVKSVEADLFVVPLDPAKNSGQLPTSLEWLTDVIPCNLWLIR